MELRTQHIRCLYKTLFFILLCFTISSCTEQYAFKTSTYENILVVQANITNEYKKQEIKISRSYRFEESGPTIEEGATVYVTDNDNNTYSFSLEKISGLYVSNNEFQAIPGKTYQLNITTKEGKSYSSSVQSLTPVSEIQVEPKIETIKGEKGVQIVVSSYDPDAKSKFYRYEYDETYKIIAPDWKPEKLILAPFTTNGYPDFLVVPREGESRICYTTKKSDNLILMNTVGLSEDRINLPIRFIDIKNPILNERYSIIVRQYVQNLESYTYYKTLKSLSTSESIFSQVQPGFNYGNLKSNDDPSEKIIGFFEVSSISSKRIFFNFRDIFIDDPYPPYYTKCETVIYTNCWKERGCGGNKILSIVNGPGMEVLYYGTDKDMFVFITSGCTDCTKISSNIKPLFWID
ncbi:DUF4249 domain-containing protein [Flavobacterium hydatis]|uniref:DUF4249 domain-containing protein n=1 Tax=Flavobacterium hydatis TaxID=991 RepID=A0A086AFK4_FLAHY|nr:DUF4249 domain-containing protein [Flavobacterium hydatis]KFF15468.1 hypothetical protein IW20_14315 [Flavobacterium hydatis]OXA91410.1 hypothetical protein B0A62_17180 [Flavobacterium hydatis]